MIKEAVQIPEGNINLVWSERNQDLRLKAIEKIYTKNATLYHVGDKVTGHEEINNSVTMILKTLPPDFVFSILKPIIINHDIARVMWGVGRKGQAPVSTGMDIVQLDNGKIKSLYVFLD